MYIILRVDCTFCCIRNVCVPQAAATPHLRHIILLARGTNSNGARESDFVLSSSITLALCSSSDPTPSLTPLPWSLYLICRRVAGLSLLPLISNSKTFVASSVSIY